MRVTTARASSVHADCVCSLTDPLGEGPTGSPTPADTIRFRTPPPGRSIQPDAIVWICLWEVRVTESERGDHALLFDHTCTPILPFACRGQKIARIFIVCKITFVVCSRTNWQSECVCEGSIGWHITLIM